MAKLLFPELSYKLTGFCFNVHKNLGRFCREKQYADALEILLKENKIPYKREYEINNLNSSILGNKVDFLIADKILLEVKAKKFITKEDYNQMQRYLRASGLELGLIVNFHNTYLKPKRVLNYQIYSDHSNGNSNHSDRYQVLDHKADLKIRVFGKTKKELFENVMIGMFKGARYQEDIKSQKSKVKIKIKSTDLPSLLVDFLSEILYLVETRKEVYQKVNFRKFLENEIEAELIGQKLKRMGVHIKAVTYHDLDIHQKKDGTWEAIILFDI